MAIRRIPCFLSLLLVATPPAIAAGQPLTERAVLTAPDAVAGDELGLGVALSRDGTTALAGARRRSCADGVQCGAVYAYLGGGGSWGNPAVLVAADAKSNDEFGASIALSADGSTAIIGASFAKCGPVNQCGAAYVFRRVAGTWSQVAKLTASDAANGAQFGFSVALSADGTEALVGAPNVSCPATFCGEAYIFSDSGGTWSQRALLAPPDLTVFGNFGQAVALSADGTTALVGDPADPCPAGFGCGAAYVFMGSGADWTQIQKLAPGDPLANSDFGWSVALSLDGATALVGRPFVNCVNGQSCGTAHLFTRAAAWSQVARLTSDTEEPDALFGFSAALTDDGAHALLGSPDAVCLDGSNCGDAFLFDRADPAGTTWSLRQRLAAANPTQSQLGISVGLSNDGDTALAGANTERCAAGNACGAAHVFAPLSIVAIPALRPGGLALLAMALAGVGAGMLRWRGRVG
jgi:hypothetical protein